MKKSWENDSCEQVQSYYTIYPVPVAAALWCGVPPNEIDEHLKIASDVGRAVYRHPYIKCLEPRCKAIHEAIDKGALLVSRENGEAFDGTTDHVAPKRRHVSRQNLKDWIAREFPAEKPEFLFDEIERKTHAAINADTFRALQADRDALKARIDKAEEWSKAIICERKALKAEIGRLQKSNADLKSENEALQTKLKPGRERPNEGLGTRELNSLLVMFAAVSQHYGFNFSTRGAANEIVNMANEAGLDISNDTVRKYLNQIPDVVEARSKK
jgi:FtsZ-binding cell division protein ZapB